jgi:hypothetical protein
MARRSDAANARGLALGQRTQWGKRGKFEGRAKIGAAPFDAVELELGALWI